MEKEKELLAILIIIAGGILMFMLTGDKVATIVAVAIAYGSLIVASSLE